MFTVSECKLIWKSLKDAVRYRKNKLARAVDDEPRDERYDFELDWEFSDCLSYLMDAPVASFPQRYELKFIFLLTINEHLFFIYRSFTIEFENSQTSEKRRASIDSSNIPTSAKRKVQADCNDDTSVSESNFSYVVSDNLHL